MTGPSGSGKSSLLYILGALEPPSSGSVLLNGRDPFSLTGAQLAAFRNQEIGFVFQDHCLLPQLSVLENVLVPTLVAGRASRRKGPTSPRGRGSWSRRWGWASASTIGPASCPAARSSGWRSPGR